MFFQMISYSTIPLWVQKYNIFSARAVNFEEDARNRGEYIAHKLYDKTGLVDFDKYIVRVSDYETEWVISYSIPPKSPEDDGNGFLKVSVVLGGGGPEIHLNKTTGKITYVNLQR